MPDHPSFVCRLVAWMLALAVMGAGGIRGHGDADAGKSVAARTSAVLRASTHDANAFIAWHTLLAKPFSVPEAGRETTAPLDLFPHWAIRADRSRGVWLHVEAEGERIAAIKRTLVGIVELRI